MDDEQIEGLEFPEADEAPNAEQQEEMLPKSRVTELLKKAKLKGRDQMQEQLDQLMKENESLKSQSGLGSMPAQQIDVDALTKQITENMRSELASQQSADQEKQMLAEMQKVAENYHHKMSGGKEAYEDCEAVMADFYPTTFPNLIYLATNADNTADIMYDIAQNPNKYVNLGVLSERNPQAAAKEIAKLSQSIKANQQAKAQEKSVNPPLSRMQPSPTGQDGGGMEIADFKKKYRG